MASWWSVRRRSAECVPLFRVRVRSAYVGKGVGKSLGGFAIRKKATPIRGSNAVFE